MKGKLLLLVSMTIVLNAWSGAPKVPMGVRTMAFVNVDVIRENEDWSKAWDDCKCKSQNAQGMADSFFSAGADPEFREYVQKSRLGGDSVRWVMLAIGKVDLKSAARKSPSFAVVVGGRFDEKNATKFLAEALNNDKPDSVSVVKGAKYDTYVVDFVKGGEEKAAAYLGGQGYYAPIDSGVIVFASNERMLKAFQAVYSGKQKESKRFASVFAREPNRIFAARTIGVQDFMLSADGMYDPSVVPAPLQGVFSVLNNIKELDLNFTTVGVEQKLECVLSMNDLAAADEGESFFNALFMLFDVGIDRTDPCARVFTSLKVSRSENRVSCSSQCDFLAICASMESRDESNEEEESIEL